MGKLIMNTRLLLSAVAVAAAVPVAASAASSTFTGPRVEVFGGADRLSVHERDSETFSNEFDLGAVEAAAVGATTTTTETYRKHRTGGIAGAEIGYDFAIGDRLVVGAFGSFALPTTKVCESDEGDIEAADVGFGSVNDCLKIDHEIAGGARVGIKLAPSVLLYAKGGYVRTRFNLEGADGFDDEVGSAHLNRNGWRAGAGAEIALNQHAYVKIEYDYTKLKSYRQSYDFSDDGFVDTGSTRVRLNRMQALAGFGVRF